jgi:hypothetical protein
VPTGTDSFLLLRSPTSVPEGCVDGVYGQRGKTAARRVAKEVDLSEGLVRTSRSIVLARSGIVISNLGVLADGFSK